MKKAFYFLIAFYFQTSWPSTAQTGSSVTSLNQCIEAALINNPNIKEAGNESYIAAIGIKTAQSGLFPVVSSEVSGGLSNEYRLSNNYKIGTAKLSSDQALWQKRKIVSSIEQARYNSKAYEAMLEGQKQEIIVSVKTMYYTCLQQNQLYQTSLDNVSKVKLFLEYAAQRYKIGVGRKSDVLKAESDLMEAEFESNSYLNSLKQSRNELAMLTGLSFISLSNLNDTKPQVNQGIINKQADSLYTIALIHYPELQAITNQRQSQEAKIKEVRADLYPRLGVNAGYDWSYNPIIREQKGWYSVLTLRWNLYNGNAQRNRLKMEQIRKNVYDNQTDKIKNQLIKEVSNRLISLKEAENQITLTFSLMKTTSENLDIAQAQYKAGIGSMLELADSRVNDLSAKQKNIQAIAAYQIAMANLERLIGNTYENK